MCVTWDVILNKVLLICFSIFKDMITLTLKPQEGGGGTFNFLYVGMDPASPVYPPPPPPPQNIRNIRHTLKKYFKFSFPPAQKKTFQFCKLTLRKSPKMYKNDPQNSAVLWWPPKYPNFHHTPKYSFSENPKNIEIQNLDPKNGPSRQLYENIQSNPQASKYL